MKKFIFKIVSALLMVALSLGLVACNSYTGEIPNANDPNKPSGGDSQHQHSYTFVITKPTCTAQGYTTYSCTCGDSYVSDYTNPSHTYEITIVTAPGCQEQGFTTYKCNCGHSYDADFVSSLGGTHNYVNGYCTKCERQRVWSGEIANSFEGGNGTIDSPYQIATGEQLALLATSINESTSNTYYNKYYELVSDINLNGLEWNPIGCYWYGTFSSSCSNNLLFGGRLEGNNHVISNFKVTSPRTDINYSYYGLFGGASGTIQNLGVENFTINMVNSSLISAGGLVGYSYGAKITNCYAKNGTVEVEGGYNVYAGGFVGQNLGQISKSYANVTVKTGVSATEKLIYAGGLVGQNSDVISNSFATGSVNANYNSSTAYLGGLVGYNIAKISNSYASSNVNATSTAGAIYAGGFIGYNKISAISKVIENNFACGNINVTSNQANVYASGFMSYDSGNCFKNIYRYALQEIKTEVGSEGILNAYKFGTESSLTELNSASFYTDTLKWDATIWNLTNLDVNAKKLPTLK